ncbi:MAG: YhcG family protein [Thermoanaerobaculia bacterium]
MAREGKKPGRPRKRRTGTALTVTGEPEGYADLLARVKQRVRTIQTRAALAANRELLRFYWLTGRDITVRQQGKGWGSSVIERLAHDLAATFPGIAGLSARNLWRMRAFYLAYEEPEKLPRVVAESPEEKLPRVVAEIPWGHHVLLLEKVKDPQERIWYARAALEHGWARSLLQIHVETGLYHRQGKAINNFHLTLPPVQSDLAANVLKDPYLFDFLTLGPDARERDIEQRLVEQVQRFLLELGVGFAYMGRQVHLDVGGEDFYIDLLFYHVRLRCYVVIEIKAVPFQPEFVGKLGFYLAAVDAQLRHGDDQPSIGLLLCKSKNHLIVEYALRDLKRPIGVADWETRLVGSLPEELQGSLPTVEQLEAELLDGQKA